MNDFTINEDRLLQVLSKHIGVAQGIGITELAARCDALWMDRPDGVSERHVRKRIEQLRMQGHHICAHPSTGYFLASTPEELDQTCLFLYGRAMTSLQQISRMKRVSLPDLRGQLNLPT